MLVILYMNIQGGVETEKTINFGGKLSFILSFLFPLSAASTAATYIFSLLLPVQLQYLLSWTLCIKCWVSAFRTEVLEKFPYFADTTEKRGIGGWKEAQKTGVTLPINNSSSV